MARDVSCQSEEQMRHWNEVSWDCGKEGRGLEVPYEDSQAQCEDSFLPKGTLG